MGHSHEHKHVDPAKLPRPLSIVRFDFDSIRAVAHSELPFTVAGRYLFLGEIPNLPGHGVVVSLANGAIHACVHVENFVEAED